MLPLVLLCRNVADSSIMDECHRTAPALSNIQGQKSLTLRGCSFLGHRYNVAESIFAWNGGQQLDYGLLSSLSPLIIEGGRLKIVDPPLTLIFRAMLRCRRKHFRLERWLIVRLWINVVAQPLHYRRCQV